ncbi:uncharacterized protein BT62DRAFT_1080055 [Guyanagaster necrorhizus]|uniref:Uncharacterized protein n=1 Tax=Guyanagaster necrorhizus TaxID=856835 RepID=A0A9P7VK96_9AGAR|nr:uncharacterized protein BT62DRAFT_1080055 [Guyanagaster necrorhizus MCA 3950]KAG7441521.1 hypothetical protein BT62DRAFT_1080055 [Guyanagaster necrorhizus MCA 3950]
MTTREGNADSLDPRDSTEKLAALKQQMLSVMERTFKNRYLQPDKLTLVSLKLVQNLADHSSEQRGHIIAFFRALALCHTVLSDKPEPQELPYHLDYKAESPDAAARDIGFPFVKKSKDTFDTEVMGQSEKYTLLKVLEFNSTRKRMSTVFRCPDGRLILYCKGADGVIYARLAQDHDPVLKEQTSKDMEMFANNGLRTLCITYRWLTEEEYLTWSRKYDAATSVIENRDEEIDKANEPIEHSLQILGATALEDKLQGVPEATEAFHRTGIKLWILTGKDVKIIGAGKDAPAYKLAFAGSMGVDIKLFVDSCRPLASFYLVVLLVSLGILEIVMVRLQGDFAKPLEKRFNYKNCIDALFRMVREEGVSLGRGVGPNMFRSIPMNASQLASYDFFKAELLKTPYSTTTFFAISWRALLVSS